LERQIDGKGVCRCVAGAVVHNSVREGATDAEKKEAFQEGSHHAGLDDAVGDPSSVGKMT